MAIYTRKNSKYYWTKFNFHGQTVRRSTGCTTKVKARDFEASLRSQLSLGRIGIETAAVPNFGKRKTLTVQEIITDYIDWASVNCADSTIKRYKTASRALVARLGDHQAAEIERSDVEAFIVWRRSQKKKAPARKLRKDSKAKSPTLIGNASVNRELTLLSAAYNRQVSAGRLSKNPLIGIKPLKERFRHSESVVSRAEFQKYILAANQPLRDVAAMLLECGLRKSWRSQRTRLTSRTRRSGSQWARP